MNGQLSKSLEFETFNPIEFDGIKTGCHHCTPNCGEFAIIGAGAIASNPLDFEGVADSAPPFKERTTEQSRP